MSDDSCRHDPPCVDATGHIHFDERSARKFAHDLRGHAAVMMMNAEVVLHDADLVQDDRLALVAIGDSARALVALVQDQLTGRFGRPCGRDREGEDSVRTAASAASERDQRHATSEHAPLSAPKDP